MIKANELRIGNWVLYDDGGIIFKVKDINTTTSVGIGVVNNDEETWIELEYFSPIPLTPEILEKAGFIKNYKSSWLRLNIHDVHEDQFIMKTHDIDDTYLAQFNQGGIKPPCKYLHQLQNLYFALTGEELNINL